METLCTACGGKTYTGKNIFTKVVTIYCYDCNNKSIKTNKEA